MAKNKNLIQLPGDALEKLQQERLQKIQAYMDELGKHASIEHQAFDLVMSKVLKMRHLNGTAEEKRELVEKAGAIAQEITRYKLQRLNEGVKQIMREQNVHDVPAHIAWSARRAGVELVEEQSLITDPEAH